ncbi:MAG: phosphoribosylamine--glycine ligase [Rikenellaceae bacterium]|nr:phosphoribosylamine--glycine ligase [Rikenellaceae bacterium]
MKLPESVKILLLGSGGRESALAWKIARSPRVAALFIAPGNAGTAAYGTNVDLNPNNFGTVKQFILTNNINLVVVGPEEPLVKGLQDYIREDSEIYHVPVIGPSMLGAKLEGSKDFAKGFMARHGIPTADYKTFTKETVEEGFRLLESLRPPYVLKADGLAAGKGVLILGSLPEAKSELENILGGKFGAAGNTVVIEQYLEGIECSVFVATDGKNFRLLPVAKDYKRIGEGDTGPNTGGMGAVSPVPFADDVFMGKVRTRIVEPTVEGLAREKIDYRGFIFIGLMNVGGEPYVIEYNVRLGDPETEAILPLIESDMVELFESMAFGNLDSYWLEISPKYSVTVMCVAGGYPGDYQKGDEITGLDQAAAGTETLIFQAGTAKSGLKTVTNGGRVLSVTSLGETLEEALAKSYAAIDRIEYRGKYCRRDIGQDLAHCKD